MQAADEIVAALFVTPLHRKFTLSDLGEFDARWWPTLTHQQIARAVGKLYLQGERVTPQAVEKHTEGVIPARTIREMISGDHADWCYGRFDVMRDDFERRTWARQREAIRLACVQGATRAELEILLADSAKVVVA
jgi:hypothetical protein